MRHVPHVYLPRPWPDGAVPLPDITRHHLVRVLRRTDDSPVSYTDGAGVIGTGTFVDDTIVRGDEVDLPAHARRLVVAVAPPSSQDRTRFVVEKLAELGVDRLQWITTAYGQGRSPRPDKSASWAVAALQQSRGAWLMEIGDPVPIAALASDVHWVVADVDGAEASVSAASGWLGLVIGPEGGLSPEELDRFPERLRLGATILRTETAALVGATRCLHLLERL